MKTRLPDALRFHGRVLKGSVEKFLAEDVATQAAAMAFYMVFSLPSILLIILWTAARFYREAAVREAIFAEIGALVGQDGAQQLVATVERVDLKEPTWWATAVGIGVLLFTATNVLVTAQSALNRLFEVPPTSTAGAGLWAVLRHRFISFALIVTISFMLLVSLFLDALIAWVGALAVEWIGVVSTYAVAFDSMLLDVGAAVVLFALFFRYLPDVQLKWKDTWFGGLVTAGLFTAGKYLIGLLIGNSSAADLYEAAGSVLVLMLWVYYASAIFLFGATFTSVRVKALRDRAGSTAQSSA